MDRSPRLIRNGSGFSRGGVPTKDPLVENLHGGGESPPLIFVQRGEKSVYIKTIMGHRDLGLPRA